MAYTLRIEEAPPAAWPSTDTDLTAPSTTFLNSVWQRLEAFVGYRWGGRAVTFTVEGPGDWSPPLRPTTVLTAEIWGAGLAWEAVVLNPSPLGGFSLDQVGPYRFIATVGSADDPPPAVQEAFRRLAHYMADNDGREAGMTETSLDGVGSFKFASPTIAARALAYSGAADLLRPYRNLRAS